MSYGGLTMRIAFITAGAGGSYCGACMRDVGIARGLIRRGHDVLLMPIYTPLVVEGPDPSLGRVFYGGINAWLQQHSALFRHTPAALDRLLDRPGLLRRVSRFAIETRPEDLGAMTVSVLRGPAGRQAKELDKLVRFLERVGPFDLVHLTNSLLGGMAPTLKGRLGAPVVCSLQGEEFFIQRLGEPYRDQAVALLRDGAGAIDLFVAPGEAYADEMASVLAVERSRIRVVPTGIDLETYRPEKGSDSLTSGDPTPRGRVRGPFRIGFLSRLSPAKGLDVLCEAFGLLARRRDERMVLAVAGQPVSRRNRFWRRLLNDLGRAGLVDRVEYAGAVDLAGKVAFLRRCSVFSVPSRLPERRGVAVLEALACGVPVVLPRRRGYDEIVSLIGGGVLVEPDDAEALAGGIETLLDRPDEVARLARSAAAGAARHFSATLMVDRMLQVYRAIVDVPGAGRTGRH